MKISEIKNAYRVWIDESTQTGSFKERLKTFKDLPSAVNYAKILLKDLKRISKETDDPDAVVIEDSRGTSIGLWVNRGGGVIENLSEPEVDRLMRQLGKSKKERKLRRVM